PLLAGRASDPRELDRLSWDDWMTDATRHFDELARDHPRIVVGGLSAGGTMALSLSLHRPVASLLLYAAALSLQYRVTALAPYLWRVVPRWPRATAALGAPGRYERVPVRAVGELVTGMRRVRARLGEIHAPALVVHSIDDPLVPVASARRLARELGGPVELLILPGRSHAFTAEVEERDRLGEVSVAQLWRHVPLGAAPNVVPADR
ncbi:MAG: alpha/beta hydrolase, partial [Chloroflexota bacterium]|nr:alpha/beta hydrolase [Chloroflexota bacterium]